MKDLQYTFALPTITLTDKQSSNTAGNCQFSLATQTDLTKRIEVSHTDNQICAL